MHLWTKCIVVGLPDTLDTVGVATGGICHHSLNFPHPNKGTPLTSPLSHYTILMPLFTTPDGRKTLFFKTSSKLEILELRIIYM